MDAEQQDTPRHRCGDYVVDEATRQVVPSGVPWVGRVQFVCGGSPLRYVVVAPTGGEWWARLEDVRPASAGVCVEYDAVVERRLRGLRELGRRLVGSCRV
ncbi:hypothetical protein [Streptomyces qinglanensis]|uniref:hypothetical protein n=1 Tax=Streptomyces qinglanensis TaxID=943816 RepID=UPI003788B03C